MPHGLPAERQIADIVLPDLQRELFLGRQREETRRLRERVLDQFRRDPVIGDDEKPGILTGTRHCAGQRGAGPALAGQNPADIEERYAALIRPDMTCLGATRPRIPHRFGWLAHRRPLLVYGPSIPAVRPGLEPRPRRLAPRRGRPAPLPRSAAP